MLERIEINLLPAEYRIHRTQLRLRREFVYPLLFVMVLAVGMGVWMFTVSSDIAALNKDIATVEVEIKRDQHVLNEIRVLRNQKAKIGEKIQALKRIDVNREKWIRLLEVLGANLPRNMWLSTVEEKNVNSLLLKGKTFSFPEVAAFMTRLTETDYIKSVDVSDIQQRNAADGIFEFTITCQINPDAGLLKPVLPETKAGGGR